MKHSSLYPVADVPLTPEGPHRSDAPPRARLNIERGRAIARARGNHRPPLQLLKPTREHAKSVTGGLEAPYIDVNPSAASATAPSVDNSSRKFLLHQTASFDEF